MSTCVTAFMVFKTLINKIRYTHVPSHVTLHSTSGGQKV